MALLPQDTNSTFPVYTRETNYYSTSFEQSLVGMPLEADSSLTIAQKQKFTIREISPDWGYAAEATKVCFIRVRARLD